MPTVKYVSNGSPQDNTAAIKLESGTLRRGGDALEITDEEFSRINGRFQLEVLPEPEVPAPGPSPEPVPAPVAASPPRPSVFSNSPPTAPQGS